MTIQEAVKEIISQRGIEIFKNSKIFFASIDDLAPEHRKERIILRRNVDDSILNLFIDNTLPINTRLVKIKTYLEDFGLADDSITFIIETFGIPLGYEKNIEDLKTKNLIAERIYAPAPQINNTQQKVEEITLNDDALKLLGYVNKNTITKLNILGTFSTPSGIAYKITAIENSIFANCTSLTHVVIPNTVKSINPNAFKGCTSLKQVNIPDSVKFIGSSAFENCNLLTVITIPNGVTEISQKTFCGCKSLTIVNIPDTVKKIGESAFEDCASLSKVTLPDGVTKIEKNTFCGCKSLVNITLPDSVTEIGSMAFFECESLNNLVIPEKVANLGLNSFSDCKKLTKITAPVRFFKDEYIQEVKKEEPKGRLNNGANNSSSILSSIFQIRPKLNTGENNSSYKSVSSVTSEKKLNTEQNNSPYKFDEKTYVTETRQDKTKSSGLIKCKNCGALYPRTTPHSICPICGGKLIGLFEKG